MRSLATPDGRYTDAQVSAQLKNANAADGCRFDVLDNSLGYIEPLSGVTEATVEMDVDRKIKGSLELRMQPQASMVGQFLKRKIRPWYRLSMPDGGVAEIPMGVFVWSRPKRSRDTKGDEMWSVTMGDQSHLLDLGGPGINGFRAPIGARIVDVLGSLLQRVGITDVSGLANIGTTMQADTIWSTQSTTIWTYAKRDPVTLLDIAAQLHDGAGVYGPYFDLAGRYRLAPVPDLATIPAFYTYATTTDSILSGFDTDSDLSKFANRVTVRANGPTTGFFGQSVADADTIYPGHPSNHAATGIYVDPAPIDDNVAASQADLDTHSRSELLQRLSFDYTLNLSTMANPAHEAYEVIGTQWDGDADFALPVRFHERQWRFDLFGGSEPQSHRLNRLY